MCARHGELWHNINAQRFGRPNNRARYGLEPEVLQVLIGELDPCNFVYVLEADGARCRSAGLARSFVDSCGLLEEIGCRRSLGDECERPVGLNGDQRWNGNFRCDMSSMSVKLFAEVHRFHAACTQRWANGWGRRRLARRD